MTKTKILYYTDCFMFGGAEKPMFEVISSTKFRTQYEPFVIYRYSDAYYSGMRLTYPTFPINETKGIRFPDRISWDDYLGRKFSNHFILFKISRRIALILFRMLLPLTFIYEFIRLYFVFRYNKADIVHINNGGYPGAMSCIIAAIAAKAAGIRNIIFSVHNMAANKRNSFDRFLDRLVEKSVTVFITGSKAAKNALSANIGVSKVKIINIYHGVGTLNVNQANYPELRDANNQYILMVTDFDERKGHKYLIVAFKHLISKYPQFNKIKLVLIGDGLLLNDIKMLVAKERVEDNVVFLGRRTDYLNYLASCLFLLNPSLELEDLPYIILEAMSVGVPVIGTDVAGIPEEIENGVSGIIIPPRKTEALMLAMHTLLSDQVLRAKMRQAAKERVAKMFTLDRMIDSYINIYDNLLKPFGNLQVNRSRSWG